jgi:hypothetical protein
LFLRQSMSCSVYNRFTGLTASESAMADWANKGSILRKHMSSKFNLKISAAFPICSAVTNMGAQTC